MKADLICDVLMCVAMLFIGFGMGMAAQSWAHGSEGKEIHLRLIVSSEDAPKE